ncbi:hypothetical protein ScPMuIL_003773 [Solemya velum]
MWKITLFLALAVCLMFTANVDALASQKNQEVVDFDGQKGNSGMEILLLYFLMNGMNRNQQQQKIIVPLQHGQHGGYGSYGYGH